MKRGVGSRPQYSGPRSKNFWASIAALKDPYERSALYSLGMLLQNNERYVLEELTAAQFLEKNEKGGGGK